MPNWCGNDIHIAGPLEVVVAAKQAMSIEENGQWGLSFAKFATPRNDDIDSQVEAWGTKWDVYPDAVWHEHATPDVATLATSVDTAWAPPIEFFQRVATQYPDLSVSLEFDEPGMDFWGRTEWYQGKVVTIAEGPSRFDSGDPPEEDEEWHSPSDNCHAEHYWMECYTGKEDGCKHYRSYLACGQDFMAGTICSDHAGHDGPHSALCVPCGGDWVAGTCTCPKDEDAEE